MKKILSIVLSMLLVLTSVAYASGDSSTEGTIELPEELRTTALIMGEPAIYTGLLVGEKRFSQLMKAELDAEDFRIKLGIERRAAKAIEATYKAAMKELAKPIPWYMKPWFNRILGSVIAAGLVLLSVWVGIKITEARQ